MRPRGGAIGNKACATAGYAETDSCNLGECRTELDGEVPSFEQFTAQHSRADADSAVWAFRRAALQQSISPIAPPMLHDCSLECRGAPANAPPATINKSTSDVNRVLMAIAHCMETTNACQDPAGPGTGPVPRPSSLLCALAAGPAELIPMQQSILLSPPRLWGALQPARAEAEAQV